MTIRPVELNGVIQRTQDMGALKQQEDVKPMADQQTFQLQARKDEMRRSEQVNHKDDADNDQRRFDAKEKGNGQYQKGKNRKKGASGREEGKVVIKGESRGFDMKI